MDAAQADRIERFKKMAEADPDNELGHFSLGKAYLEVGEYNGAAASFERTIGLNPAFSKAYQMLGEALDHAGKRIEAIDALTRGVRTATRQGDVIPRDAMAALLREWGVNVPEFETSGDAGADVPGASRARAGFQCSRCGKPTGQLDKPPFKGTLGEKIHANVCRTCWQEWIPMGTKVINELGLVLKDSSAQAVYDQHLIEFLQLEER